MGQTTPGTSGTVFRGTNLGWAFVSPPKIKLAMTPFRLLNVMGE